MLFLRINIDIFLDRKVPFDEKWSNYDNSKCSSQQLDCDEYYKHFRKPMLHQQKVIMTALWSTIGIVDYRNKPEHYSRHFQWSSRWNACSLGKTSPALVNRHDPIPPHDNEEHILTEWCNRISHTWDAKLYHILQVHLIFYTLTTYLKHLHTFRG